jgi:uncharacterized protein YggE
MKILIIMLLLGSATTQLQAQMQGNFKSRKADEYQQNAPTQLQYNYRPTSANSDGIDDPYGNPQIIGENLVEFRVNVLANQKADSYTAIFNVVQLGKTTDETNTTLQTRLDAFITDMKKSGIQSQDIYVDMVNFLPKFEYDVSKKIFSKKTFIEVPIGFELQKNIHVRFTKPEILDLIVAAAARQEIYDIVKVDYFVKDSKSIYTQMRNAAIQNFKEIKSSYVGLLQLDSAYIVTAENTGVTYPGERYKSYQAFTSQLLDPSQRADSKIERADKPISQFYDAIAGNNFDVIINPEILEPCVQFSYQLLVRCQLKERYPNTNTVLKKEFIMVTPNGEVKTLKID